MKYGKEDSGAQDTHDQKYPSIKGSKKLNIQIHKIQIHCDIFMMMMIIIIIVVLMIMIITFMIVSSWI
jgi:heme/copper-type cytochrome/quinol oxidase subunit 2